eukprot:m.138338 g.138338  ORF g.138338 m.138338 type:complete len:1106 (-) comp13154_c4_seq20:711-4028(-)
MADKFKSEDLARLNSNTDNLRNICIIAHVDHGKTTMADSLLATNGIISDRLSGKLRYMDSRDDEQQRGITMKSSGVTLLHKFDGKAYVINLIDSPGHVDFSSEVSTAARLSDGAVVLVDVVEGVSAQTHAVLRQAWLENVEPCLVLNKIDRLIVELKMTPMEAYDHIHRVLEQVNLITANLFTGNMIARLDERADDEGEHDADDEDDDSNLYFEPQKGNVVFASALDGWGCTIFDFADIVAAKLSCAADALKKCLWGNYYLSREKGSIKVRKGAQEKGKQPLFVMFVLTPIWSMYESIITESAQLTKQQKDKVVKMAAAVGAKLSARDLQAEPKVLLKSVMSRWIPVGRSVLNVICNLLPSPRQISDKRINSLLFSKNSPAPAVVEEFQDILTGMRTCSLDDKTTVAFVSKMVAVEKKFFPESKTKTLTVEEMRAKRAAYIAKRMDGTDAATTGDEVVASALYDIDDEEQQEKTNTNADNNTDDGHVFVAYTRVYSGTIRPGMKIQVLGPRYDPIHPDRYRTEATVERIYLFMGRSLLPILEAPAGSVVGLVGLSGHVLKTATLSSTPHCPRFHGLYEHTKPIVRVALETDRIGEIAQLQHGLELLNKADPCVEVLVQESGEYVLAAAGEVHIERCITDLRELFCPGISFKVSPPIIPFRETLVRAPTVDVTNEDIGAENAAGKRTCYLQPSDTDVDANGVVTMSTMGNAFTIKVRAFPLDEAVVSLLQNHTGLLKSLTLALADKMKRQARKRRAKSSTRRSERVSSESKGEMEAESLKLQQQNETCEDDTEGENESEEEEDIVVGEDDEDDDEMTEEELKTNLQQCVKKAKDGVWKGDVTRIIAFGPRHCGTNILTISDKLELPTIFGDRSDIGSASESIIPFINAIQVGYQMATQAGPLCEETIMGTCFEIVDVVVDSSVALPVGYTGNVISTTREACKQSFLSQHVRLMTAMFSCDLLVNSGSLGKVHGVLSKRNGKISSEEMKEGSDNFLIKSIIPATHVFGFAKELRKKTSGLAAPQLFFSHWEVIQEDPFWVPTTEEELAHFGEKVCSTFIIFSLTIILGVCSCSCCSCCCSCCCCSINALGVFLFLGRQVKLCKKVHG